MKVITTSNQKGGVGKTVISSHLAKYLGGGGKEVVFHKMETGADGKKTRVIALQKTLPDYKVLFIDSDPQGNGGSVFAESCFTGSLTYDLLTTDHNISTAEGNITVVKGDSRLKDIHLLSAEEATNTLISNLNKLEGVFDYIIVDTQPTENITVRAIFVVTDYLIAPIIPVKFSLDGIGSMLSLIFGMKKKFNPELKFLGMLPSKVVGKVGDANKEDEATLKRLKLQQASLRALLQHPKYGGLMLLSPERQLVGISERQVVEVAVSSGETVWESRGADALASTQEFFAVFDAIEHKIGGF